MTRYTIVALLLCIILTVGVFGSYASYEVEGIPQGEIAENVTDSVELQDALGFLGSMLTFSVAGMPVWMYAIFVGLCGLTVLLLWSAIRGGGG